MTAASSRARLAEQAPDLTITCVRRDPADGTWTARVTVRGETFRARRRGGWQIKDPAGGWRFALPPVAARLEKRAGKVVKAEQSEAASEEAIA